MPKLIPSLIFTYFSQGYTSFIALVTVPIYMTLIPSDEFGLIGLFLLLSQWMQMLTIGLSPTLARYVAIRETITQKNYAEIIHNIEALFLLIAVCTIGIIFFIIDSQSLKLLVENNITSDVTHTSIKLMCLTICMRWFVSLYSSGLTGLEEFKKLSVLNVIFATLRYFGGVLIVIATSNILAYFYFQMGVVFCEAIVFLFTFYLLHKKGNYEITSWYSPSYTVLRKVLPFSLATGYTAIVWILVSQYDKMLLTASFSLEQIGYFSFGMLLANGILKATDPIFIVLTPRLTKIVSSEDINYISTYYQRITQYIVVIGASLGTFMVLFKSQVLMLITQNSELTGFLSPMIGWIFAAYTIFVIAKSYFILQVAYGDLKIHVLIGTLGLVIQIPLITIAAWSYGTVAVVTIFFAIRLIIFMIQTILIANKFKSFSLKYWTLKVLILPFIPCIIIGWLSLWFLDRSHNLLNALWGGEVMHLVATMIAFLLSSFLIVKIVNKSPQISVYM